jgi:hypothetical protein
MSWPAHLLSGPRPVPGRSVSHGRADLERWRPRPWWRRRGASPDRSRHRGVGGGVGRAEGLHRRGSRRQRGRVGGGDAPVSDAREPPFGASPAARGHPGTPGDGNDRAGTGPDLRGAAERESERHRHPSPAVGAGATRGAARPGRPLLPHPRPHPSRQLGGRDPHGHGLGWRAGNPRDQGQGRHHAGAGSGGGGVRRDAAERHRDGRGGRGASGGGDRGGGTAVHRYRTASAGGGGGTNRRATRATRG